MGLLTVGNPLSWDETKSVVDYVKDHGLSQFINLYHRLKLRQGDCLRWGDEIEYMIVKFDKENKKVHLSLRGEELLTRLQAAEEVNKFAGGENPSLWRPEYAAYMLEGTPGTPYGGLLACFNVVESNMRRRREEASKLLKSDETLLTCGSFPLLGCPDFTWPHTEPTPHTPDAVSRSLFFPDQAIFGGHPRYRNLTRNIRGRRGEKVVINVPIFRDENTPDPFIEDYTALGDDGEAKRASKPNHIYMDCMGFGMGCCCLQVTFQAVNVSEARWLYDQLTPITPILLALSSSTPVFRGFLADVDSRWDVISASVDDRTTEERGLKPLKEQKFLIGKSRYDTTDCYIYPCSSGYNDIDLQYEQNHYEKLLEGDIDTYLATHIAHLFIRDPLQIYKERIEQDDEKSSEHFETIQSSNWCNMRFKPPPLDAPDIGWRVEFRPTEVQLTDFENAAYVCFVVLLTRVIISYRLSFLIPISKVNENMSRAQKRDAVLNQKFFFRRGLVTCNTPPEAKKVSCKVEPSEDVIEMTLPEIVNGKPGDFPGLVPLIRQYLDSADVDVDTRCTVSQYLNFIQQRASGKIWTLAHWIRHFVRHHPQYKNDSVVSESMCYDLVTEMNEIAQGRSHCTNLLGNFQSSKTDQQIPSAIRKGEETIALSHMFKKTNNGEKQE